MNLTARAYATLGLILLVLSSVRHEANAAAFTAGNLVIYRAGVAADGSNPTNAADSVFLDEYTTSAGQTMPVQSIAIPTTTVGAQRRLTVQGSAALEGMINRSADGRYLLFAGYDAAIATAVPAEANASVINRVVGRIDAAGNLDTSTALTDWSNGSTGNAASARSVMSTDGTTLLLAGAQGGVRQTTLGSTTSTSVSTTIDNVRHLDLLNGQVFISTGTSLGAPTAVLSVDVGTGMASNLPGFPTVSTAAGSNIDPYGFFLADLSPTEAGVDTLYVADNRSQTAGGGLRKYSLVSGTWMASGGVFYTAAPPAGEPSVSILRGLTGAVSGSTVTLFATRNQNTLQMFTDTSGYNGTLTGIATNLATAPANTFFKGLDFAPVSSPTFLPGDFNHDTFVNGTDLGLWQTAYGSTAVGDADGDGDSDGNDFRIWQQNVGATPAVAAASAVPEPAAALLACLAAAGFVSRRRGR